MKRWLQRLGLDRKELRAWALYDWANSAFATTMLAALLPIYYARVAGADLPGNTATVYWGYTVAATVLLAALLGPILGAISDYLGSKKIFLAIFAGLGIVFSAALYFVEFGDWKLASALFLIANLGFSGSVIFYNALLPHIAKADEVERVSSAGYAIGYLGGGLLFLFQVIAIQQPHLFGIANSSMATRLAFISVAIWWFLFSIPLFRRIPEPPRRLEVHESLHRNPLRIGFQRLFETLGEIQQHRELFKFLLAFWLYSDGIGTIIKMAAIYGTEVGIGVPDLLGALLLVQVIGVPFTFLFGSLGSIIGPKRGIFVTLAVYAVISLFGYFMAQAWHFWALAILVGLVQGGSQALSRSLYSRLIPKGKSSEFFSFYGITEKFAGFFGPLMFAAIGQWTGSSRLSIAGLLIFFVGGIILLASVDVEAGRKAASREEAALRNASE